MANQDHLNILKQGVAVWNRWREEHPDIEPGLQGAFLREAKLSGVNLRGAIINDSNISVADLNGADLRDVKLYRSAILGTDFTEANLSRANLGSTNLRDSNLSRANLSETYLLSTDFSWTDLSEVHFTNAEMGMTVFGYVDLSTAKGLETVKHSRPSIIATETLVNSGGNIPTIFLRGAGVSEAFITYARSLIGVPIDYYTCFISYSSKDEAFAKRLYADLQNQGVRCWFAPEDLKWGDKIRPRIDESIRIYDKLLLVLSQHSVTSQWVEQEVEAALAKERKEQRTALFPIRLDQTVMEIEDGWPALIRNTRNIGDFTRWKRHDAYQKALDRLLRDLKAKAL